MTVDGVPVGLSRREVMVLAALMERPDVSAPNPSWRSASYGWQEEVESNASRSTCTTFAPRSASTPSRTVRGLGYRMRAPA